MNKKNIIAMILFFSIFGITQNSFAKKLNDNKTELALFNAFLEKKPLIIARAKYIVQLVEKIEQQLEKSKTNGKYNIDQKTIVDYRDALLATLIKKGGKDTSFLEDILSANFILKPIAIESIGREKKDSLLLKFLDVKKEEANSYFQKNITDISTLVEACNDFKFLMQDVIDNISTEAKKNYEQLEQKMISRRNSNSQLKK